MYQIAKVAATRSKALSVLARDCTYGCWGCACLSCLRNRSTTDEGLSWCRLQQIRFTNVSASFWLLPNAQKQRENRGSPKTHGKYKIHQVLYSTGFTARLLNTVDDHGSAHQWQLKSWETKKPLITQSQKKHAKNVEQQKNAQRALTLVGHATLSGIQKGLENQLKPELSGLLSPPQKKIIIIKCKPGVQNTKVQKHCQP